MADYEEAIKKKRPGTTYAPGSAGPLVSSLTTAVTNITAAVSATSEALTTAREGSLQRPTGLGCPVFSRISL